MPTEPPPIRVVKLGGSLLDFVELPGRIDEWLRQLPTMKNIFVVGGGHRVDLVRQWEGRFSLDSKDSHWNCIEMMQLNAIMVASWFQDWMLIDEFNELSKPGTSGEVVFAARNWLLNIHRPLPESWDVTSDSIAARLAAELRERDFVILKSADPPEEATVGSLVESGYLDKFFSIAARSQKVRWVNLRGDAFADVVLDVR